MHPASEADKSTAEGLLWGWDRAQAQSLRAVDPGLWSSLTWESCVQQSQVTWRHSGCLQHNPCIGCNNHPQFYTSKIQGWHTSNCTVGNAHWSLMFSCHLSFSVPIINFSTCYFSHFIYHRVAGAHWIHVWFVFSRNLVISTVFSGLIYCSLYPSITLNQGVFLYSLISLLHCCCSLTILHNHQLIFATALKDKA